MKSLKLSFLIILVTFIISGCEKFLSVPPEPTALLNSPEAVSELLVSAYPKANYWAFCEGMSDNVTDITLVNSPTNNNLEAYSWQPISSTSTDSPTLYWNRCYAAIAVANLALQTIEEAAEPQLYTAQKGEALLARAYSHFMLVTLFSKVYNPATAGTDLGIPYVKEVENVVFKQYERKTVAYVYEQIEKDLEEGLPLINDNSYKIPSYHFNKRASYAFATRFYLFKKDFDKVIHYADLAFPNRIYTNNMRQWNTTYSSMSGANMRAVYTQATEKANLLLVEVINGWSTAYDSNKFGTSREILFPLILRLSGSLIEGDMAYLTASYSTDGAYINKLRRNFIAASVGSSLGTYYTTLPLLTTEEVLFNLAEALAMRDRYTETLALLNQFGSMRIRNYTTTPAQNSPERHVLTEQRIVDYYSSKTTDLQEAYVHAVLDLKRPEFLHEGLRWFDVLRKGITVVHNTNHGEPFNPVLLPDDPRRVLQIPLLTELSGLEPNP